MTLLLGLVLGSLFGYWLADDGASGRAANRRVDQRAPRETMRQRPGAILMVPNQPATAEVAHPDARPPPAEAGKGWLVVETSVVNGYLVDGFELAMRDMRGDESLEDLKQGENGLYRIQAYPGRYLLNWHDEIRSRSIGVEIRAGETRHLRLSEHAHEEPPIPTGFGRLLVKLIGVDQEPVPHASVMIVGRGISDEAVEEIASALDGVARVVLRPGHYEVRGGCVRQRVVLRDGEETICVCDHSRAGEVRLPAEFPGKLFLRRPKELAPDEEFAIHFALWPSKAVVFVRPGQYEYGLLLRGHQGRAWDAGRVFVSAGRAALVEPSIPRGALSLEVAMNRKGLRNTGQRLRAYLKRRTEGMTTAIPIPLRGAAGIYRGKAAWVPPGEWDLEIHLHGFRAYKRRLSFANTRIETRVVLERLP